MIEIEDESGAVPNHEEEIMSGHSKGGPFYKGTNNMSFNGGARSVAKVSEVPVGLQGIGNKKNALALMDVDKKNALLEVITNAAFPYPNVIT